MKLKLKVTFETESLFFWRFFAMHFFFRYDEIKIVTIIIFSVKEFVANKFPIFTLIYSSTKWVQHKTGALENAKLRNGKPQNWGAGNHKTGNWKPQNWLTGNYKMRKTTSVTCRCSCLPHKLLIITSFSNCAPCIHFES